MNTLAPQHAAELNGSRIAPEIIEGRQYRTLGPEHREQLEGAGCPRWAIRSDDAFPGLFLPMYAPKTGEYIGFQFKPAVPQPRPGTDQTVKYASPKGMGNRLDVHPSCTARVADAANPLWITEGLKKGDALASRGLATITLTGVWNWRNTEGSLAEWEDVPLKGRTVIVCFDADAVTNPKVRNAMKRLVGWLRKKTTETGKVYYLPVPEKVGETPVKGVDDYLAAGGTLEGLHASATERAPDTDPGRNAEFSDVFLTDTVCAEALAGQYLWARGLGWMAYNGARWVEASESTVVEEIRQWVKAHWESVLDEYKRDQSRDVKDRMEEWKRVLSRARLSALASLARGPLETDPNAFDAQPDLLNCPNGVVDLRSGELLEPDPSYLFTKVAGVPYDPAATDPDFTAALGALPTDVQGWYQMRIGQAFTGHMTPDDLFIVQQGGGQNGKSTLAVPISRAAGGFQVLVSHRVILGNHDQHPTEKMDLKGARYALMEETPEARQLNVQQLKEVVGTPEITARRIRENSVTFKASHSLFVNTNFKPAVAETDLATWRRLAMVRFPYTFRSDPREVQGPWDRLGDPGLRERLATAPGGPMAALAWAVAGAVRWYASGFGAVPDRIRDDTRDWRREGDLILNFLEQRLEVDQEAQAKTTDVFQAFGQWLGPTGHKPWTIKTFNSRFGGHDEVCAQRVYLHRDRVRGMLWVGVRLRPIQTDETGLTMM